MITVWKFQIPVKDQFAIRVPQGGEILAVQTQRGKPTLWIRVDTDRPDISRFFCMFGTGRPIPPLYAGEYVGTFQMYDGDLVIHLYEGDYDGR